MSVPPDEELTYLVANRNHGRYFADLLASLEAQTDRRWQCVVADDASTDDSPAVIAACLARSPTGGRIRLVVNEHRLGYTGTLKRLLPEADTDIVGILDADDALMPEATAALLAAYREHPAAGLVHARHADYDAALQHVLALRGEAVPANATSLRAGFIGHPWTFRRRVYARTTGWDEAMLYAEDRDLIYKLEEVTRPVFVDRVLYRRRVLSDSQSHDPQHRRIGRRHHLRAERAALRRRGVRGWRFAFGAVLFWLREPPQPIGGWLAPARRLLVSADQRFAVVPNGRLLRG